MKITYDKNEDIAFIQLLDVANKKGVVDHVIEAGEGIFIHYTKEGKVFGVEFLDASSKLPQDLVSSDSVELLLA